MTRKGTVLFVTVETPLHAGTGAELDIVDLPIQRERHTGWPKVEASGLKGALREVIRFSEDQKTNEEFVKAIFGPETGELHSGALVLTDLRILLFPIKSAKGTFAWVISPEVYNRFRKDLITLAGLTPKMKQLIEKLPGSLHPNTVHPDTALTVSVNGKDAVLLEEYSFNVEKESQDLGNFVRWLQEFVFSEGNPRHRDIPEKICVIENDMFNDFVRMFTEVITRTKIDPATGTVQGGALWNEEYLPAETVMYSLLLTTPLLMNKDEKPEGLKANSDEEEAQNVLNKVIEKLPPYLFLGGNETIGKGLVSLKVLQSKEAQA